MPLYELTNRVTGDRARVEAPYAQDARNAGGWPIGETHVRAPLTARVVGGFAQIWAKSA